MKPRSHLLLSFVAGSCMLVASPRIVHADEVACQDLPNPVFGLGGSASKPLLARVGAALATAEDPLTVIYQAPGACFGITTYVDGTPATGTASYWAADGTELTCALPVTGVTPDYAMLGVQGTLCEGVEAIPDFLGTFSGPVTSWSLIVPNASSQTTISSEASYFVYGYGATAAGVQPWVVESETYSRDATSAAGIVVALASGFSPTQLKGPNVMTNQNMITSLAGSTNPEAAIGFVSTEVADLNRDSVRTLAFQARDQTCSYWPDSTPTGFDKRNVRDGHYVMWTPYYFYVPVDGAGRIIHEDTRRFIGFFEGTEPTPPELPLTDIIIDNGNIPVCAMEVWRDEEIGPLYSFAPPEPCGCYYEFSVTGETSCETCTEAADCSTGACRQGFCEAY